jgi:hypothetical protein
MVNREQLTTGGLRAYEFGRLRMASRVALVLIPATAVCLFESEGRETCVCLAFVLLGLSVWLRWRNRRWLDLVTTGLQAGSLPLVVGLVLDRLDVPCGLAGAASFCTVFAVFTGGAAGIWIGVRERKPGGQLSSWLTAGAIAALAASLGCVRLGALGLASVVAGIAVGIAVAVGRQKWSVRSRAA